ncbi:MAG TPA: alpha/beta hydrolase [Vicinamibacterales bacterium]
MGRAVWHYSETGSGRPLILLHGIGMSHVVWSAVIPNLATTRRMIAFDIAGFGSTPALPDGTHPTTANLVDGLERSMREIGISIPVDMCGNSLGGYMALEAARRGLARSVVAISPAGLWTDRPPAHVKHVFKALHFMATHFRTVSKGAMHAGWLRELLLAVPISVGSRRMPPADAVRVIEDLASSIAFEQTFLHTRSPFTGGRDISVPVTVAFGDRDFILPKRSRCRAELPAHTRWIEKRGWGHVPMWVDPLGVSQVILEGIARGAEAAPKRLLRK